MNNPSGRFYAAYALAEYAYYHSGQLPKEVHLVLLESLQDEETEIRNVVVSGFDNVPHCVINIAPWVKFICLEYKIDTGDERGWAGLIECCVSYFEHATKEKIQLLEELLKKANYEEVRGISIALYCCTCSKNLSSLIKLLLLIIGTGLEL